MPDPPASAELPSKTKTQLYSVLPTPDRLDSHPNYTGKGITIAYLDSGFFPHPDLVEPSDRILAFFDVSGSGDFLDRTRKPASHFLSGNPRILWTTTHPLPRTDLRPLCNYRSG
jgi:hypothetical protein